MRQLGLTACLTERIRAEIIEVQQANVDLVPKSLTSGLGRYAAGQCPGDFRVSYRARPVKECR